MIHNKHPIITGVMLGIALSWSAAKLVPSHVAALTGLIPVPVDLFMSMVHSFIREDDKRGCYES